MNPNRLSDKRNYLNLILFSHKLWSIRPNQTARLKNIKKEVLATENIASIGWLIQKIDAKLENEMVIHS